MSTQTNYDIIIIGSGPAGYTAAIYAARAGLSTAIFTGQEAGGQLMITTDVENYPGFPIIQGPELMDHMKDHAKKMGAHIIEATIIKKDFASFPFAVTSDRDQLYHSKSIIIATGAKAKWLNIPSEETFKGFGVSACATCDGFFYRGKDVVVIGGGNTAVEEALYMTNHARHVTLIHRRDSLRAEKILQDRLFNHPHVSVLWNHEVIEFQGSTNPTSLETILLKNTQTKETQTIKAEGAFVAIGHAPETSLFKDVIACKDHDYIITKPDSTQTNIDGVFAAGDVTDDKYRQAITAAGMGCMAALEASEFIAQKEASL